MPKVVTFSGLLTRMAGYGGHVDRSEQNQWDHLVDAVVAVTSDLDLSALLMRIVDQAREVTGAPFGALGVIAEDPRDGLEEFLHSGMDEATAAAIGELPHGDGVLGVLLRDPRPMRLSDVASHPDAVGFPPGHPVMRAFLGVPVRVGGTVFGNLYLADKNGGFTPDDERVVVGLAAVAGTAVANARLYRELERTRAELAANAVAQDRDRIARDLHDLVIGRLFATGLAVDRVARHVDEPWAGRAANAVDEIDRAIVDLRGSIFALGSGETSGAAQLQRLVASMTGLLGFAPALDVSGDFARLDARARSDIHAVIAEALSNVGRHAAATSAQVRLTITDESLEIAVTDNGSGLVAGRSESGLANLRSRAEQSGGTLTVEPGPHGGTRLTWRSRITGR